MNKEQFQGQLEALIPGVSVKDVGDFINPGDYHLGASFNQKSIWVCRFGEEFHLWLPKPKKEIGYGEPPDIVFRGETSAEQALAKAQEALTGFLSS